MTDQAFAQKYLFEWHEWPPDLQARHEEIGLAGRAAMAQGDFQAAAVFFESQFRLLVDSQPFRRRIHKGESLHNWGLSLIIGGDPDAALRETLAAFIEDAASGAENSPARQNELDGPAAHNLVYVFGAWGPAIAGVGQQVRGLILDGQELPDPHDLLVDPAIKAAAASPTGRRPRTIGSLDSPVERRIFIGGNYHRLTSTLWPLADRLAPDYDGLLAADFPTPEGWGNDETMLPLLTASQFAVFEISENGGQVEEIAKTPDTMRGRHRMLAVYRSSEMQGPGISDGQTLEKLRRWNVDVLGYVDLEDLEHIIRAWVTANVPSAEASDTA